MKRSVSSQISADCQSSTHLLGTWRSEALFCRNCYLGCIDCVCTAQTVSFPLLSLLCFLFSTSQHPPRPLKTASPSLVPRLWLSGGDPQMCLPHQPLESDSPLLFRVLSHGLVAQVMGTLGLGTWQALPFISFEEILMKALCGKYLTFICLCFLAYKMGTITSLTARKTKWDHKSKMTAYVLVLSSPQLSISYWY